MFFAHIIYYYIKVYLYIKACLNCCSGGKILLSSIAAVCALYGPYVAITHVELHTII